MENFQTIISVLLGISLAAAVGFRIFVPLLVMSIASMNGYMNLSSGFEWIGTMPSAIVFGVASIFELFAYFIPFVDNLLDTIAGPTAVVAGTIVMASSIVELDPLIKWTLAIIAGGGAAGLVQGSTTVARGASTITTAGFGNSIISFLETFFSFIISILTLFFPFIIGLVIISFLIFISKKLIFNKLLKT